MNRYSLRRAQEQREDRRREQEFKRAELSRLLPESGNISAHHSQALAKHFHDLKFRLAEQVQAERDYVAKQQATAEAEALALEKENAGFAAEKAMRERQHIVNESCELRELRELIRAAQIRVERDTQRAHKVVLAQNEELKNQAFHREKVAELAQAAAEEQAAELHRRLRGKSAQEQLKLQLQYKQELEAEAKEALERERQVLDTAAQREDAEDEEVARRLRAKREEERAFIEEYLRQRQEAELHQALDAAAEDARIEEFEENQREREAHMAAMEAAKKARMQQRYESLKNVREAELKAFEEEQRLIDLLRAEELEEAAAAAARARKAQKEHLRRQMAEANARQLELKAAREVERKAEEERYRVELMARFAEEDRLEQMNAQKRRLRLEQHKREAERLIAEKRALVLAAQEAEAAKRAVYDAEQQRKAGIVQEERERLLSEARDLRQYLPASVLANASRPPPLQPALLD